MILEKVPVLGALETNVYFYVDDETNRGVIIDPGAEATKLAEIIRKKEWIIEKILITHGHFDHIGAVEQLHEKFDIPYFIHKNGEKYLTDISYNLSVFYEPYIVLKDANFFEDGDAFSIGKNNKAQLQVIYTPGHTTDSVIFYDYKNGIAFSGDTIFKNSIGAVHFPGGDARQLADSVFNRIFKLPEETLLYSGHSDVTSIKAEKSRYYNYD